MSAAENCTCAHQCHGSGSCIAIYVHDKHQCWSLCSGGSHNAERPPPLTLDQRVNAEMRDATVADIGKHLAALWPGRILAPVTELDRRMSLKVNDTTFAALLDHAGLTAEAETITNPAP